MSMLATDISSSSNYEDHVFKPWEFKLKLCGYFKPRDYNSCQYDCGEHCFESLIVRLYIKFQFGESFVNN